MKVTSDYLRNCVMQKNKMMLKNMDLYNEAIERDR